MDNPGASLFQGTDIQLSNSQNNEEEEDLEDQRRRNEELQNLLMAKLDDFNFDESTVNSSNNVSLISIDGTQNKYKGAVEPHEQLQVLYDVRVREINCLKEEYNAFKINKTKEIEQFKRRLTLAEAEIQQLKISLSTSESLLVEKTTTISELKSVLTSKDEKIRNYEETIKNLQLEITAYTSTINDLQLKVAESKNPFSLGAKRYNSEELQRAHEEQVHKLENMLHEQIQAAKQYEKEKYNLHQEIDRLIKKDDDDKNTINILTNNFDSAQKQCQELIEIIEKLTIETHHLQERINTEKSSTSPRTCNISENSVESQIEKLKKMLLDKSIHIDTLNKKLENFENSMKELLEYRQLKTDIYNKKFQQCENQEHTASLLVMQNELQNYKRMLEDKSEQIVTLNTNNREYIEKIEELISQNRNDIQNFSYKYNMPRLKEMVEDLEAAQETIKDLEAKLKKSEERRSSLAQKLNKPNINLEKNMESQLNKLKCDYEMETNHLNNQVMKLEKDLEASAAEIIDLKVNIEQLTRENTELKTAIKENEASRNEKSEENLKKQFSDVVRKLQEYEGKIRCLEKNIEDLTQDRDGYKIEKNKYESQLKKQQVEKKNAEKLIESLKNESALIQEKFEDNMEISRKSEKEQIAKLNSLKEDLVSKDNALKAFEENNDELVKLLQKANAELKAAQDEVSRLNCLLSNNDKPVRRKLEGELINDANQMGDGQVKEAVQDDDALLKMELKMREQMQNDYFEKLNAMEKKYQQATSSRKDIHKTCMEKLKNLESKHLDQLTNVLSECAQKFLDLQNERDDLLEKLQVSQSQFEELKVQAVAMEESYGRLIEDTRKEGECRVEEWKKWSNDFVANCMSIERTNTKSRSKILKNMISADEQVAAIEKLYNDKIKKYVKNCKI